MSKTQHLRIQLLRNTEYGWTEGNYKSLVLKPGEIGLNTTSGEARIGDGTNTWANLKSIKGVAKPHIHEINDVTGLSNTLASITADYNETIIGLSVEGQTVTYIKGDGSVHSFETQDTNTTYSLGTDEVTGLTKLYATIGSAEDGTMTQKAIKTELDKKVGVTTSGETLVFTI